MVVLYDAGDHADLVLKTASWLEHSGKFKIIVLSVKRKDGDAPDEELPQKEEHIQYLTQIGVEFTEVYISEATEKNPEKYARLISSSINASEPDLVITGLTIGKFSFLDNQFFATMLDRFNCPAIVARAFVIPGVSKLRAIMVSLLEKLIVRLK
jgi:hypothetical protein